MTLVRLEPAALRSRAKHSTTEPLRSPFPYELPIKDLYKYHFGAHGVWRVCLLKWDYYSKMHVYEDEGSVSRGFIHSFKSCCILILFI